jgi:hypothetical protein
METDFKNQLLIGALAAAVLGAAGYGLYQESNRVSSGGPKGTAPGASAPQATETVQTGPATLRIETVPAVLAGSTGHRADVAGGPGLRFEWSIQGGTLESGMNRDTAFWSAGEVGEVTLICRGFNAAGAETTGVARIPIKVLPTISRFEAAPPVVTAGLSARLGWAVKDHRRLMLSPGALDVTDQSGPGVEVKPVETTAYTLIAVNSYGDAITRELIVKVVPPPELFSLRAEPRAGSTEAFSVIGEFKGGKAELSDGSGVIARSETSPLRAEIAALKPGTALRFVVTNEGGSSLTSTLQASPGKPQNREVPSKATGK